MFKYQSEVQSIRRFSGLILLLEDCTLSVIFCLDMLGQVYIVFPLRHNHISCRIILQPVHNHMNTRQCCVVLNQTIIFHIWFEFVALSEHPMRSIKRADTCWCNVRAHCSHPTEWCKAYTDDTTFIITDNNIWFQIHFKSVCNKQLKNN